MEYKLKKKVKKKWIKNKIKKFIFKKNTHTHATTSDVEKELVYHFPHTCSNFVFVPINQNHTSKKGFLVDILCIPWSHLLAFNFICLFFNFYDFMNPSIFNQWKYMGKKGVGQISTKFGWVWSIGHPAAPHLDLIPYPPLICLNLTFLPFSSFHLFASQPLFDW